jgi:hypothetical protein
MVVKKRSFLWRGVEKALEKFCIALREVKTTGAKIIAKQSCGFTQELD